VLRKRPAGWLLCRASQFSKRPLSNESASPLSPDSGVAGVAYAKIFMALAATSLSLAGVVIVGALGQTIRTTAGMSAGSTNSMTIVSSLG
jgi:hypothetical protein